MKEFFNRYWFLFIFPLFLIPAIYFGVQEEKFKNFIFDEALNGNQTALILLKTHKKPWTLNEKVVRQALKNNVYAKEILEIEGKK